MRKKLSSKEESLNEYQVKIYLAVRYNKEKSIRIEMCRIINSCSGMNFFPNVAIDFI